MKYMLVLALPLMLSACTATQEPRQRFAWENQIASSPALMSTITDPMGMGDDERAAARPYYLDYYELFPAKDGGPAFPWD